MSTYCIGDVQGCYKELHQLLEKINFDPHGDTLWFVGDLVNRGPNSLEVLRFVKNLPNKVVVLGNHDLHLLNYYHNIVDFEASHLEQILSAEDAPELITWLRSLPLIHVDQQLGYVMVHAGIYPEWSIDEAQKYAREVEQVLRSENYLEFLKEMYGNQPNVWHSNLIGWDRLRFIVNAFTRMRFIINNNQLDFSSVGTLKDAPSELIPWFQVKNRKAKQQKILFGHWAALKGEAKDRNVFALDTGCVWGGSLTTMRLEDERKFACNC